MIRTTGMHKDEERLCNPFWLKWRHFKDAEHEMCYFKRTAPGHIERILLGMPDFRALNAYTGFHVFNDHPQTLQGSFGNRSMFRQTLNGKTASENGASLVYSQGPSGEIHAILYPARSDVARVTENLIFLRFGSRSAIRLIDGLERDLADLIAYELVTSLDGSASLAQRVRIQWLRWSRRTQRDSGYNKPATHRALSEVGRALTGRAAAGSVSGIFKVLGPLAIAAALTYLGYVSLAAKLTE